MQLSQIIKTRFKQFSMWLMLKALMALAFCFMAGWLTRELVLSGQIETLRQQSRHHIEFYCLSLESQLSRNESLPKIIAMEASLKKLLLAPGSKALQQQCNNYLRNIKNASDINTTYLMDINGLTLSASNSGQADSYVGNNYAFRPYFKDAMQGQLGVFYGIGATTGNPGFFLTAPIKDNNRIIGAATVKVTLEGFESALTKSGDKVLLADSSGVIFLGSVPDWKYRSLTQLGNEALVQMHNTRQYSNRILQPLGIKLLGNSSELAHITLPNAKPQDYLVQTKKIGPLGWSMVLLAETRQERQSALMAGIAAGFAAAFLLSVITYYKLDARRYRERRQAEADLRQAHRELEERIAERTADLLSTNARLEENITSLKTTEIILRETRDQAVQAGKLAVLGQMAAGISHEINQPLTALQTFSDNAINLLERGRTDDVRENLKFINQMAVRMGQIVGEIKTFSRKPPTDRMKVCISDAINQAMMLIEPRRRQLGAGIIIETESENLMVSGDMQRLEQILVNLLRNALDAVADLSDKRIEVNISKDAGMVKVVVCDSGCGLSEESFKHLFEPFFTTKSAGQGLGLGLYISRMIASELGGKLEAQNRAVAGAEFTLILEAA